MPEILDSTSENGAIAQQEPHRKRRHRSAIAIVALLAAAAVCFVAGFLGLLNQQETTVTAAKVTRGDLVTSVRASGTAQPISSTYVSSGIDGTIQDVRVAEGDVVSAGDVLFAVENDQVDTAVADAQQQVVDATAARDQAQQAYDSTMASFQGAIDAWNAAPDGEAQRALTDPRTMEDEVRAARQSLADAQATLDGANQALTSAQAQKDACTITAPVGGTVVALKAHEGASVGQASGAVKTAANLQRRANTADAVDTVDVQRSGVVHRADAAPSATAPDAWLVQIGDVSQLRVPVQLDAADAADVAEGQTAQITFPDVPDLTLDATVEGVAAFDAGAGSGEGSDRSAIDGDSPSKYQVNLLIGSPDERVKAGMDADVSIEVQRVSDVLMVPVAALQDYDKAAGTASVTVLTIDGDDKVTRSEQRDVTVDATNETDAAVEGVTEGELVEESGVALGPDEGSLVSIAYAI